MGPAELDRVAGTLVGLAAGDALGAGYEFQPIPDGPIGMIGGGLGPWWPGEWTDDTQLALCVAESAATGRLDPASVGDRFLGWFAGAPKDVGIQTARVLTDARTADDLVPLAREYHEQRPDRSAGNGSLMRTAPVALAHLGDDRAIAQAARAISDLTHADPVTGDACVLWCIAVDRAVRHARLDGVRDGLPLLDPDARTRWAAWLDEAETRPPEWFVPNGYVVRALQAAWAAIAQTPIPAYQPCRHLATALERAVRVGDDTDTVAAIAGALLGARWGSSAVPMRWRVVLHGWPGYRARDLVRLAVLAANHGHADAAGWPSSDDLTAFYASTWPEPAFRVALPDDDDVVVGNAAAAAAAAAGSDCDVIVSLCRMGAAPLGREHHDVWLIDSDDPDANPNLDFVLADTAATIEQWREEGGRVLVHCVQAISRTPAVAAAYLARRLGVPGLDALVRVERVMPQARPNAAFRSALERIGAGSE
jgi:ADP-ribosyl-[dinitrogen reductase] hydrolase